MGDTGNLLPATEFPREGVINGNAAQGVEGVEGHLGEETIGHQSMVSSLAGSLEGSEDDEEGDRESGQSGRCVLNKSHRAMLSIAVLTLVNLLNYMDRFSVAGVLQLIQTYYGVDFTVAGLIQTAFILSYMLLSPLFGYLGDRYQRTRIMAGGILFWALATLLSSFVGPHLFPLFLLMRALVGVGEASYSTIAPTIIADLYVGPRRTTALTAFYFAIPVGSELGYIVGSQLCCVLHSGLGYIVGSQLASAFGDKWQWALRITPALGLVCAVLILTLVQEPVRGAADGSENLRATSYLSDLRYLFHNKSFLLSSAGFTCVAFVAGALALWAPSYIANSMRARAAYDWRPDEVNNDTVSLTFGIITCVAGIVGVGLGSWSASRLRPHTPCADPLVCAFGLLSCAPFLFLSLTLSWFNVVATWTLILIGEILLCLNWALITDMLLYVVIPTRRATAEAVQILMSHVLGDAGSPFLIGVITDAVVRSRMGPHAHPDAVPGARDEYVGLQYGLLTTCFVCVLGGAFFLFTSLFIVGDRRRAENIVRGCGSSCQGPLIDGPIETDNDPMLPAATLVSDDFRDNASLFS